MTFSHLNLKFFSFHFSVSKTINILLMKYLLRRKKHISTQSQIDISFSWREERGTMIIAFLFIHSECFSRYLEVLYQNSISIIVESL